MQINSICLTKAMSTAYPVTTWYTVNTAVCMAPAAVIRSDIDHVTQRNHLNLWVTKRWTNTLSQSIRFLLYWRQYGTSTLCSLQCSRSRFCWRLADIRWSSIVLTTSSTTCDKACCGRLIIHFDWVTSLAAAMQLLLGDGAFNRWWFSLRLLWSAFLQCVGPVSFLHHPKCVCCNPFHQFGIFQMTRIRRSNRSFSAWWREVLLDWLKQLP